MYKIYVNGTPIYLLNTKQLNDMLPDVEKKLVGRYPGRSKFLLQYIDLLEKTDKYEAVIVHASDVEKLFADFVDLFRRIDAAGGVVFNPEGEVLMIYRLQHWDLPKGKVDKGETIKAAALREVQEETGLQTVEQHDLVIVTWHTYRDRKDRRVLKRTHWYRMTTEERELIPQTEENIELAVWRDPEAFLNSGDRAYGSIVDVLREI